MKIELFISQNFTPCREAARVWARAAGERGASFRVVDIDGADGQVYARHLSVGAVPMVFLDGAALAIGVQTIEEARQLLAEGPAATPPASAARR